MQYIRNWNLVLGTVVIVALSSSGPAQRSARAQNSLAGWADGDFEKPRALENVVPRVRATVARVLKAGKFETPEEEQDFTTYYQDAVFPSITDPANRLSPSDSVIAKLHANLDECGKKPEQQVFDKLADLVADYMAEVAGNSHFHPAARVNAMLAIGEVNSPKAAKLLLDAAKGEALPLRVAAMAGLVRMAGPSGKRVLSNPEIEPLVIKVMVPYAKFHATKKNDGISWMRGQAADVLGDLGDAQTGVSSALLVMLEDKDLPIPLRSRAARALGKLDYAGSPPAAGPYLKALAVFADDALSSDQPADRARVRQAIRDVESARKKFVASTAADKAVNDGLEMTLQKLDKETVPAMTAEDLKTSIKSAKESLDDVLKR